MDNNVVEMNILDGNSISIFAQNKEDKYVIIFEGAIDRIYSRNG